MEKKGMSLNMAAFVWKITLKSIYHLTNTGPHVHGSHETIITQTAIFAWNIGALASITDVWSLLTLINVY